MAVILDAGALVAIDKRAPRVRVRLNDAHEARIPVRTSAAVVAQVWRSGTRQAHLARVLAGVDVRPLDAREARSAGELQAATGTSDVVDAHVSLLVEHDDHILTSDPF